MLTYSPATLLAVRGCVLLLLVHECLSASFVCENGVVHSLSHIMCVVVVLACMKVLY